jgi:hypothetical protein
VRSHVHFFCMMVVIVNLCAACGTSPVEENAAYMIFSNNTRLCLDVPGARKNAGVHIIIWNASDLNNPAPHQTWYFRKVPDGYKIFARHSNLCLNVAGGSSENNASIIQWPDSGENAGNEIWQISGDDSSGYTITSKLSGKLLSTQDLSTHNGVELIQHEFVDTQRLTDAQTWKFKKLQ